VAGVLEDAVLAARDRGGQFRVHGALAGWFPSCDQRSAGREPAPAANPQPAAATANEPAANTRPSSFVTAWRPPWAPMIVLSAIGRKARPVPLAL
jgi:hypothetical protein